MLVRPVFIFGARHSGTTVFYNMLALHPDVCWFSQFSQRGRGVWSRLTRPAAFLAARLLRGLVTHSWQKRQGPLRRFIVPHPTEAGIWQELLPGEGTTPAEALRRIRLVFTDECRLWRKHVIVAKLPGFYRHLALLREAFPEPRLIHIVRDGRAVALSNRRKFGRRAGAPEAGLPRAAAYWRDVLSAAQGHDAASLLELRYEDYCADVHGHLSRALTFCGLDPSRFPFRRLPRQLQSTNPRRLAQATADERRMLDETLADLLRRHGYEL